MSDDKAARGGTKQTAGSAAGGHNPWLIAGVVSIATFMEVLDITIIAVALQHVAGSLAVSNDEATWISTSYLVSNAIVLPISGWLSTVIGRKRFYMGAVTVFTVSSLLCGLAWDLNSLIFFRILQGLGGGGLAPSEQSILADTFPPEKRGQAFALQGLAVVLAPALGPTLGGIITDNASWHWIFFINIPMGILSLVLVGTLLSEPATTKKQREKLTKNGLNIDWLGIFFIAVGLGCLEYVLDQGQRADWFASRTITIMTVISVTCLLASIPWELYRKDPIVNVRLLFRRQFGTCFILMMVLGGILVSTTQSIPQLLQTQYGYTATLAGYALSGGGLALLVMMPLTGYLSGKIQPMWLVVLGFAIVSVATRRFTSLYADSDFNFFAWSRVYVSVGFPFLFLSVTTACYVGLKPDETNQASALINVARNLGGSILVSFSNTLLQDRAQFHQSRLVEHVTTSSSSYQDMVRKMTDYFTAKGSSALQASNQATAYIGGIVQKQAAFLSYMDLFYCVSIIAACAIPLAFLLRRQNLNAPGAG